MTRRFRDRVTSLLLAPRFYLGAMFLIALAGGLGQYLYIPRPDGYTRYNNYLIFKFVKPYVLKAVPVILAWLVLTAELVLARRGAPPGGDRAAHVPAAPERAVLPEA